MTTSPPVLASQIVDAATPSLSPGKRAFIALAGPPASGKSTLAEALVHELAARGMPAGLLAMDGFHMDNAVLRARGLLHRKGAPETFDLGGLAALLGRLRQGGEVLAPSFDRSRDVSVGASVVLGADLQVIVVEGNYLLLDQPGWRELRGFWDFAVQLDVPREELRRRLAQRWQDYGLSPENAAQKIEGNDLPNADVVNAHILAADFVLAV